MHYTERPYLKLPHHYKEINYSEADEKESVRSSEKSMWSHVYQDLYFLGPFAFAIYGSVGFIL